MTVTVSYQVEIGPISALVDHTSACRGFAIDQRLEFFRLSSQSLTVAFTNHDGAYTPAAAGGTGAYASTDWFGQAVRISASTNNGDDAVLFVGILDQFDLSDTGIESIVTMQAVDWLSIAARGPFTFPGVLGSEHIGEAIEDVLGSLVDYTPNLLPLLGESDAIVDARILTDLSTGVRVFPLGAFNNQGDSNVADVLGSKLMPGCISLSWGGRVDATLGKTAYRPLIVGSTLRRNPQTYSEFEQAGAKPDVSPKTFPAALPLDGDLTNNGTAGTITLTTGIPAVSYASMALPAAPSADGASTGWTTDNATLDALGGAGCWAHAIYIPSGLSTSTRYALWKNGGSVNGQGMYLQRVSGTDQIRVTLVSVVSSAVADSVSYVLPSHGYYTVGAEIPNTTLAFMRLFVNGVVVAEKAFLSATPTDGTGDPGFYPAVLSVETGTADLTVIDGSGILVSHLVYGGYEAMTVEDQRAHYRLLFEPETFEHQFVLSDVLPVASGVLPFRELDVGYNSDNRINFARLESNLDQPFGGTATVEAVVTSSVQTYGVQTFSTTETEHETATDVTNGAWQIANRFSEVRWTPKRVSMTLGQFRHLADATGVQVAKLLDHTSGLWNEVELTSTLTNASSTTSSSMIVGRSIRATPEDTTITLQLMPSVDLQPFELNDSLTGVLNQNRIG